MINVSSQTNKFGTRDATWYKVPYLTANHFIETYHNITYFQNIPHAYSKKHRYSRQENDIQSFSNKSRVRALQLLNMIDLNTLHIPYFVTLTYHNDYPEHPRAHKKDFHSFLKRFRRRYRSAHYFWRVELQSRGAPHYHLIIWFPRCAPKPGKVTFIREVQAMWLPFTRCECKHCHAHAVKTKEVGSFSRAVSYVAKYLSKSGTIANALGAGRIWGKSKELPLNQKNMIYGHQDFITLLQHSCVLWALQYTFSNPDYLVSLLSRPTGFIFIPAEVVSLLNELIESGCDDPVKEASDKLDIPLKRILKKSQAFYQVDQSAPASAFSGAPAGACNLPVLKNNTAVQTLDIIRHNCRSRKNIRQLKEMTG